MSQGELSPFEVAINQFDWLLKPELAAFRCGRLVNQIENMTSVLWIVGGDRGANLELGLGAYMSSQIPWSELILASRGAIYTSERRRIEFASIVDEVKDEWNGVFECLWHHEECLDHNQQIEIDRQRRFLQEEGLSDEAIIANHCRDMLQRIVNPINSRIFGFFCDTIGSRELEFFRLGQHVDRLVRPVPAFQVMTQIESTCVSSHITAAEGGADNQLESDAPQRRVCLADESDSTTNRLNDPTDAPWRLPRLPLPSTLPSAEWSRELRCRAVPCRIEPKIYQQYLVSQEIGLREVCRHATLIADSIELGVMRYLLADVVAAPPGQSTASAGVSDTSDENTADTGARQNIDVPTPQVVWSTTRLGLEFREDTQQVRTGKEGTPFEVPTRLSFNLLRRLAKSEGRFTSKRDLEDEWMQLGGSSNGRASIHSQLTKVRKILRMLGKKLENRTNFGWRIADNGEA